MAPLPLDYVAVAESFKLPAHANFGGTSGVAFNSKGNIFVIHRGPMPLMEFDPDGHFIRGFGDGLFERPHGLRLWTFASNTGAQRFYARHGFVEVRRTDGRDNEERAPDVLYAYCARGSPQVPL